LPAKKMRLFLQRWGVLVYLYGRNLVDKYPKVQAGTAPQLQHDRSLRHGFRHYGFAAFHSQHAGLFDPPPVLSALSGDGSLLLGVSLLLASLWQIWDPACPPVAGMTCFSICNKSQTNVLQVILLDTLLCFAKVEKSTQLPCWL
jgi:hypothetical protein